MSCHIPDPILQDFLATAHAVGAAGLLRCSSGNMSLRLDDERLAISCSGSWLGRLAPEQVSICRIADGALLHGARPSAETRFHAGVLRVRPDVNVVLHFQAPYATALACRPPGTTNYFVIPEMPIYMGPVAEVPWFIPGSEDLAGAVIQALQQHDIANLDHHGQVTVGTNLAQARQNAEFFELACQIIVQGGPTIRPLTDLAIHTLLAMRQTMHRSI